MTELGDRVEQAMPAVEVDVASARARVEGRARSLRRTRLAVRVAAVALVLVVVGGASAVVVRRIRHRDVHTVGPVPTSTRPVGSTLVAVTINHRLVTISAATGRVTRTLLSGGCRPSPAQPAHRLRRRAHRVRRCASVVWGPHDHGLPDHGRGRGRRGAGEDPAISPDGRYLAMVRSAPDHSVKPCFAYPADSVVVRDLVTGSEVSWGADPALRQRPRRPPLAGRLAYDWSSAPRARATRLPCTGSSTSGRPSPPSRWESRPSRPFRWCSLERRWPSSTAQDRACWPWMARCPSPASRFRSWRSTRRPAGPGSSSRSPRVGRTRASPDSESPATIPGGGWHWSCTAVICTSGTRANRGTTTTARRASTGSPNGIDSVAWVPSRTGVARAAHRHRLLGLHGGAARAAGAVVPGRRHHGTPGPCHDHGGHPAHHQRATDDRAAASGGGCNRRGDRPAYRPAACRCALRCHRLAHDAARPRSAGRPWP